MYLPKTVQRKLKKPNIRLLIITIMLRCLTLHNYVLST